MDEASAEHRMHPNSLANLQPWQPGQSGNPRGRPNAGASVIEWMNVMVEYNRFDLQAVIDDKEAPACKITAARRWLKAIDSAREDAEFVCDYSGNKPVNSNVNVNANADFTHDSADAKANSILARRMGQPSGN